MGSGDADDAQGGALTPIPGEVAARVLRSVAADLEASRSSCHLEVSDRGGSRSVTIIAVDRAARPEAADLTDVELDELDVADCRVRHDPEIGSDFLDRAVREIRRRRAEDVSAFDRAATTVVERLRAPLLGVAGDDDVP
jgi:ribosomal protein L14